MPRGATKKLKPEAVKRAADRAEAKSRGEEPTPTPTPLEPPESDKSLIVAKLTETGARIGTPPKYNPEYAEQAQKLYSYGFTDEEIADFFEVTIRTIYRWQTRYPEFRQAVVLGKAPVDDRVERALFHRAVGYTFERTKYIKEGEHSIPVIVKEHIPPDTAAALAWLKNRRPEKWRDVHQYEIGRPGEFAAMNDAELKKWLIENGPQMLTLIVDEEKDGKTEH
jgi:hypothetical protein